MCWCLRVFCNASMPYRLGRMLTTRTPYATLVLGIAVFVGGKDDSALG